ncbi:MAG: hypothetical protein HQL56_08105 [Magnetococcales bacterium]|nr:hypothetical protein [Magnetococcales bacterium]
MSTRSSATAKSADASARRTTSPESAPPPPVLLPYQQRWCADPASVKVIEKSRRVGLSWAEAGDSALLAASQKGMDVWYVGYNKEMAQEFVRDCGEWSKHYQLAVSAIEEEHILQDGDEKSILAYVIRYASGYRVTALSSRPSNLRGKQGRIIIDEAAFHDDLPELLKAALAFLMWGGQVHVISTHNGVDNAFAELVGDIRAGKRPYSLHRVTLDDALADGLYRRIALVTGKVWSQEAETSWREELMRSYGDAAEEELNCIPQGGGGKFLSRALIEQRMSAQTPVLRLSRDDAFGTWPEHIRQADIREWCEANLLPLLLALPAGSRAFFGMDFGRSGDLSVMAPLIQGQDLTRRPPFLVELRNIPFHQQRDILFYLADRLPGLLGGALDARGNGQYLAEVAVQRYGSRVQAVMLTEGWYREQMPPFKAALEDGTLADLPRDADILDDLRALEMVKGVARLTDSRQTGQDQGKRHGDAAIALALAFYASRNPGVDIGFEAVGQRPLAGEARYSDTGFGAVRIERRGYR